VGVRVIVIDNNSGERTHQALRALARKHPEVDLHLIDRNLGCAGGRRFGVGLADGEFVLFLDDDAELMPGALDHLVADLDAHPDASAVTSLVVYPDGSVFYFGGRIEETARSVSFELGGYGLRFDDPALGATGPSGWAPGGAMLARAEVFDEVPIDEEMSVYYEDNDWCLRLEHARPASLRRCHEAIAVHPKVLRKPPGAPFLREAFIVRRLSAHARFLAKHGVLLETDLPDLLPELVRSDGTCDDGTVRLLLALIDSRGPVWTLMAWVGGELEPLLEPARYEFTRLNEELREARSEIEELEVAVAWLGQRADILAGVLAGGWWRLRGRLAPVLGPISRLRRRLKRRRSE
jgi:GT2 family glycosyltransferase